MIHIISFSLWNENKNLLSRSIALFLTTTKNEGHFVSPINHKRQRKRVYINSFYEKVFYHLNNLVCFNWFFFFIVSIEYNLDEYFVPIYSPSSFTWIHLNAYIIKTFLSLYMFSVMLQWCSCFLSEYLSVYNTQSVLEPEKKVLYFFDNSNWLILMISKISINHCIIKYW